MVATNTEAQVSVSYEGQTYQLPKRIAESDELIKQALSAISPDLAGATVVRDKETGKIEVRVSPKRNGNGSITTILTLLDAAIPGIDPAILAAISLQREELAVGIPVSRIPARRQTIEGAIASSQEQHLAINTALLRLEQCKGESSVSIGF